MARSKYRKSFLFWLLFICILFFSHPAIALKPNELLVIANKRNIDSIELSHFYMQQRNIPLKNFIFVDTTDSESCSRESYETEIANPVKYYFKQNSVESRMIKCVVLMYGIPLKILPTDQQDDYQKTDRASVDSEISLVRAIDYSLEGWILNPFYKRPNSP